MFKFAKAMQLKLNNLVLNGNTVTFKKVMEWNGKEELSLIQVIVNGSVIGTYEEFKMKFVFRSQDLLFTQNVVKL